MAVYANAVNVGGVNFTAKWVNLARRSETVRVERARDLAVATEIAISHGRLLLPC